MSDNELLGPEYPPVSVACKREYRAALEDWQQTSLRCLAADESLRLATGNWQATKSAKASLKHALHQQKLATKRLVIASAVYADELCTYLESRLA